MTPRIPGKKAISDAGINWRVFMENRWIVNSAIIIAERTIRYVELARAGGTNVNASARVCRITRKIAPNILVRSVIIAANRTSSRIAITLNIGTIVREPAINDK